LTVTIKEVRQKLDLTQKQMAKLLGVTQHRVSELERGIDGRAETRQQIKHLSAIQFIAEHGLLDEFTDRQRDTY